MDALSFPSPTALFAFLAAAACLGALGALSAVFAVARVRPHLLPESLRAGLLAERRILRRARQIAHRKADRAERMQEALLSNVSHEFRTPLTGILAAAQMLREEVGTEQRELTEMIIRDSQRMHAALSQVLDLVDLEASRHVAEPVTLDVADEVRTAVASFAPFAERKGIALHGPAPEAAIPAVGDPAVLRKVVGHLVENALKFTEAGEVRVDLRPEGDWIRVDVADTGPGMAKPAVPLLFAPFAQGSQGLNRAYAGTGLGLTLTKRLVDLMGGRLTVDTAPGAGSTFSVSIPRGTGPEPLPNGST
jgi:hypothetical protein